MVSENPMKHQQTIQTFSIAASWVGVQHIGFIFFMLLAAATFFLNGNFNIGLFFILGNFIYALIVLQIRGLWVKKIDIDSINRELTIHYFVPWNASLKIKVDNYKSVIIAVTGSRFKSASVFLTNDTSQLPVCIYGLSSKSAGFLSIPTEVVPRQAYEIQEALSKVFTLENLGLKQFS